MKSPMIENGGFVPEDQKDGYSELMVLHSNAGYYIGTLYREFDDEGNVVWEEPGSRDSDYFRNEDSARIYLVTLQGGNNLPLRNTP